MCGGYLGKYKNHQDTWMIIMPIVNPKTATKHLEISNVNCPLNYTISAPKTYKP